MANTQLLGPKSSSHSIFLAITIVLFVAARLWRLTSACLWFDEIFSVHAARHAWSKLLSFAAADIIHPPLFYAILKIWIAIGGESLFWLRLLPVIFSVATIVPFLLLSRELKLTAWETTASLFVLAVNGYLIKYAQEVRMYSLLLFLATCSLWLFISLLHEPRTFRRLISLLVVNLLLVYAHYAGWILVAFEVIAIVWWKRALLLRALAGFILLVLAYAPWLYLVATNSSQSSGLRQNIGWVRKPGLSDIIEYAAVLNRPFLFSQSTIDLVFNRVSALLAFLLFVVPLLLFIRSRLINSDSSYSNLLLLFLFGPPVLVFAASWVFPYSIWGTRHLIITAIPYSIVLVLAIASVRQFWLKTTILLIVGCWLFVAGAIFILRTPPTFIWCAWEDLANRASAASTGPTPVYAFEDLVAYHLWFEFEKRHDTKLPVTVVKELPGLQEDPAFFLPRQFSGVAVVNDAQAATPEIWLVFRRTKWDEAAPPIVNFRDAGYKPVQVQSITAQGEQAFLVKLRRK